MADDTHLNVDISSLRIGTFNVRGLKNKKKTAAIINSLLNTKIEIIALQETHLLRSDYDNLKLTWNGPIIYSEGTNFSKGLCILFNNYFNINDISKLFSNDRILLCSFKVGEEIFFLCNIYAPNDNKQKKQFFSNLKNTLKNYLNDYQLQKTTNLPHIWLCLPAQLTPASMYSLVGCKM